MGDSGGGEGGHAALLRLYCRVCGRRNVKAPTPHIQTNNGIHFDRDADYKNFLSRLHEVDVSGENGEIFPKRICQCCVDLFRYGIAVQVKDAEGKTINKMTLFNLVKSLFISMRTSDLIDIQRKFPLADFWACSSSSFQGCAVCHDGGSGVDGVVSASYTELTTRPNLNPNQKVKTLITVRKMTKDEMGGDYFPDDEGESYKILEIKTGIVTEVPRAALTPQPAKKDNDVQAVAEVKGPGGGPAKRPVGAAPAGSPAVKKSKVDGATGVDPWPTFNEMLGQNKKYRADKLGEILNLYTTETPKVISDLKGAGIAYTPVGGKTHFVKNNEFKKSLNKCLALLGKINTPNKSRLMFKGINETAADGQLSILKLVGINIDLTNPKLSMLKIRIRNAQAEANKKTTVVDISSKAGMKPGISRGKNGSAGKEDVPALPRGITISKVGSPSKSQEPDGMKMSAGARKTQRQRFNLNHHYSENDRPEVSSFSGNAPLPVKLRIGGKPKIVALKKKLDELWPANRQMRADILRDFILGKAGCKQLLFARGVVFEFDQARGDYHLPEHKAQRVKHKKQGDKLTEKLSDEEWADFTCEIVFDLLHPEDTLTLRIVGLFVDPLSVNAPLHFRLLFALKKALKIDENKALSKQIMASAATFCEDKGKRPGDGDMVNALITLLYCEEFEAMEIWKNAGGKAVAPSPSQAAAPSSAKPKAGPKSKTQQPSAAAAAAAEAESTPSGPRSAKRNSSYMVDSDSDADDDPLTGGGSAKKKDKKANDSADDDYQPDDDPDGGDYEVEVLPKSRTRNVRAPKKYGDEYASETPPPPKTPTSAAGATSLGRRGSGSLGGQAPPSSLTVTPTGRGRGRPPGGGGKAAAAAATSNPIVLGIKRKPGDVSVSLERIDDPLAAPSAGSASATATDSPAKTGPGARGPRGPYMTARKKAEMSASAKKSPAILAKNKKPHANTGKQGTFHGNQFYDKFGDPKVPGLAPRKMPAGTGAPALTSAKLQPVAYENAEADDPLSGGGGGGDPLSGGGDPLTGSQGLTITQVQSQNPALEGGSSDIGRGRSSRRSTTRGVRIEDDHAADNSVGVEENPIDDQGVSPPASPPAMSGGDDDDFQLPFSTGGGKKSASATKKAPAPAAKKAGPKSKRKASTALEAEDDLNNDSSSRSQSPVVRNGGNDSEPDTATPVKSKDPFQIANDEMYSDEEAEDDDDMALTSIISSGPGGRSAGPSSQKKSKPPPKPEPVKQQPSKKANSNGFGGGSISDPFAVFDEPEENGYGDDNEQTEDDFLADLLGVS